MSDELFESTELPEETGATITAEPTAEEVANANFEEGLAYVQNGQVEPEEEIVRIAGFTEDELKSAIDKANRYEELQTQLTKSHDKAFGKIGQLEQVVRDVVAKLQESQQQPAIATGFNGQITKDLFKSVTEYFDNDQLSEALANDLSALSLGSAQAPQTIDVDSVIVAHVQKIEQDFETKLLTIQHPDWQEIIITDDFGEWRKTLKPEANAIIDDSWDAISLSSAFKTFKTWRDKRAEKELARLKTLEDALLPEGTGGASNRNSANDAFTEGLNKVIKNR